MSPKKPFEALLHRGFSITERMRGEHRFVPGQGPPGPHPLSFQVRWGPQALGSWLDRSSDRFLVHDLVGTVRAGGLCESAPCRGTLSLEYFTARRIVYSFEFQCHGRTYRYEGQKVDIHLWNLPTSHTTCFGTLVEAASGVLVSTSVVHFRFRTLPAFLASFRFGSGPGG